jgi:UTP--glucose-1-phosphate uridylyltransferase
VEAVPQDKVSRYGIVGGKKMSNRILELEKMIEKPPIKQAPSNLAIAGRYVLTPEIFPILENTQPGKGGEVQLTDALRALLKQEDIIAYTVEGKRYDIGNKMDFLKTTVEFALKRKEFAGPFREFLEEILKAEQ